MTNYTKLTIEEQIVVDKEIFKLFKDEIITNKNNGYTYNELDNMLQKVHTDYACSECFMNYYNCLCSHDY